MKILNRAKSFYSDEYFISQDIKFELEMMYLRVNGVWRECEESTRSVNLDDMIDSQGSKIFASLSEDGKGGDKFLFDNEIFIIWFDNQSLKINATNKDNFECNCHDSLQEWYDFENKCYDLKVIGIQK